MITSTQIEREIEQTRHEMDETLDANGRAGASPASFR